MKFAEKLKAARLDKGYTQKQFAEISHVAFRTIVSYEKGYSYGSIEPCPFLPGCKKRYASAPFSRHWALSLWSSTMRR